VISGFRREVEENCALLGDYAASSDDFLSTFWGHHIGPIFRVKDKTKTPENGTDGLSRNAGKKLLILAA